MVLSDVFRVREYLEEEDVGRLTLEGPTRVGDAPAPRGRAGHPRGRLVCCLTSTPILQVCICSKKIAPELLFFCLFQCFAEKEYQRESKWNETSGSVIFGTNMIQRTWSGSREANEAATRVPGAP